MINNQQCSIGINLESECHLTTYTPLLGIEYFEDIPDYEREILMWRTGLSIINVKSTTCLHLKHVYLKRYATKLTHCCNPFNIHNKVKKGSLREINLDTAKSLCSKGKFVVPGEKLCPQCRHKLASSEQPEEIELEEKFIEDDMEKEIMLESARSLLNNTLCELEVSPLKVLNLPKNSNKSSLGKRKIKQVEEAVIKKLATALDVTECDLAAPNNIEVLKEIQTKAGDLDFLVECMKEKLKVSNRRQQLQILTLTPKSWSIRKAAKEFSVSKHKIQNAKFLRDQKGIIAYPDMVERHRISKDVIELVKLFYCDDEYSRQMPGKKDYVSIGKKKHMSKKLILCNLKELYAAYKIKYPEHKIGFSKFCSLRHKWCILAGPKGTHSVCVCTIHQNVKLMLSAVGLEMSYHEIIEMIVCSRKSKVCMIHRCNSCPGIQAAQNFLQQYLTQNDDPEEQYDSDENEQSVDFKQWATTDRTELLTINLPLNEFIDLLCEKLDKITCHSFIAKSQSSYLKHLKETLSIDEAIVLVDFAENYTFVVQDEVQSYHWSKSQCSLHPVVIYYKKMKLETSSFCIISDDLNHDVGFINEVMHKTINHIKANICPTITKIHYFSDGCVGQYKNCKHFYNLCHHSKDFSLSCIWNFFATSHGKSPCDGIGGTVKRLVATASLQSPNTGQILSAQAMFEYCQKSISGIMFMYITAEEMEFARNKLTDRLLTATTVPGTKSFHQFVPSSLSNIKMKRVSDDADFALTFDFLNKQKFETIKIDYVMISQYLFCKYDEFYWLGMVSEIDKENDDFLVKFMHPHYPSRSYYWPNRDDNCWVPRMNIISFVKTPSTSSGRQYHISKEDETLFKQLLCCQ
ncbi:uncharacterized protein LOC124809907 [Hydra vulgaris]|uniref:uncharacterized protein LOC124809907 n=1 Tax=Hydra vulgaris TaxID=6087 RepID=UPI001F5E9949|nr:uncharacterized protein LOC124809907 [Hydra vulgaris]